MTRVTRKAEECEKKIADKLLEEVDTMKYIPGHTYSSVVMGVWRKR